MDEPDKMAQMEAWLTKVCDALSVDSAELEQVQDELLDLVHDVAHGPSRPGAPLTAFLVGYATGRSGEELPAAVREQVNQLTPLLTNR